MDKKKGIRRLIALGSMSAFTLASFVTTTFAFVTLNTEATVSGFSFKITDQKGLLLSVDGNNFYQDIDSDLIKKTILKNQGVDFTEDNFKAKFQEICFDGVTLGKGNKAGIYSEEYEYTVGNYIVPIKDKRVTFVKDKLHKYTDEEKEAIKNSAAYSAEYKARVKDNDNFYSHTYQAAEKTDYVFFDLWAMVADDTNSKKNFDLKFSSRTEITGKEQTVTLVNNLKTPSVLDKDITRVAGALRKDNTALVKGSYVAQDTITINPANAMRLGVTTLDSSVNSKNVYDDVVKSSDATPNANKKYYVKNSNNGYVEAPVIEVGVTDVSTLYVNNGTAEAPDWQLATGLAEVNTTYYLKFNANDYLELSTDPKDYYEYTSVKYADSSINFTPSSDGQIVANKTYYVRKDNNYIEAPVIEVGVTDVTNLYVLDNGNNTYSLADVSVDTTAQANTIYYLQAGTDYIPLSSNPSDYYEQSSININVFEVNDGLGSYAVKGNTDADTKADYNRNPELNAMYTYYNSLFPLSPFIDGVEDNGQLNTKHKYTDTVLGKFTYNSTSNDYNIVKMSVMVWLEGWDADFFAGIKDTEEGVGVKLGFEIVENND